MENKTGKLILAIFLLIFFPPVGIYMIWKIISDDKKQEVTTKQKTKSKNICTATSSDNIKTIKGYIKFNFSNNTWVSLQEKPLKVRTFDNIISFESSNNIKTTINKKVSLGKAAVGGAVFGGAGAVIGGLSGKNKVREDHISSTITITINDINNPHIYISFFSTALSNVDTVKLQETMSLLTIATSQNKTTEIETIYNKFSDADILLKFKELLDNEAITQAEYDLKKKELLGF